MGKWVELATLAEQQRTRKNTDAMLAVQKSGAGSDDSVRIAQLESQVAALEARVQWAIDRLQERSS